MNYIRRRAMTNKQEIIKSNLVRTRDNGNKANVDYVSEESIKNVREFHKSFGEYSVTPLHKLDIDISEVSFDYLRSKEVKEKLGDITFVTATDGNHGRGQYNRWKL